MYSSRILGIVLILVLATMRAAVAVPPPQTEIVTVEYIVIEDITARIPGTDFPNNKWWAGLKKYDAPQVPEPAEEYELDVPCPAGSAPMAAWQETHTAWPSRDVMYSTNVGVKDEKVVIALRSRQGFGRGYAYIDVTVLCGYHR